MDTKCGRQNTEERGKQEQKQRGLKKKELVIKKGKILEKEVKR